MNSDKKERVNFLQELKSNLNWLFSINNIDDHYVIKIFGIKICKKYNFPVQIPTIIQSGVTEEKRQTPVVVSLTSHPYRINSVYKTISLLLNQTVKPDRVVLWLAQEQFKDVEVPDSLQNLEKYGLEIKWVDRDIKSFKKLVPSVKEFPDSIIITADDDILYPNNFVESLYSSYLKNPDFIHANRAFLIKQHKKDGKFYICSRNYVYNKTYLPRFRNELMTGYGTLFPPNSLNKTILNDEIFMKEIPTNDDIWFWAMAVLNNSKIMVNKNTYQLHLVEDKSSQEFSLKNMNRNDTTTGMSGRDGVNKMCELFPVIKERLLQEKD